MKLTQQQTQVIIDNGKVKGLSTKSVIDSLVKNGYEPEGVNVEAIKQTFQPVQPAQSTQLPTGTLLNPLSDGINGLKTLYGGGEQGIANKLKQDVVDGANTFQQGVDQMNTAKDFGGQVGGLAKATGGLLTSAFRTAGDVAGTVYAPIGAAINVATGGLLNKGTEAVGNWLVNGNPIGQAITDIPALQEYAMTHPNAEEDFGRLMNLVFAAKDKGQIDPKTMIPRTEAQVSGAINAVKSKIGGAVNSIASTADEALKQAEGLKQKIQQTVGKNNANPQLETSVKKLQPTEDVVKTYDKYLEQSKKSQIDIKTDAPISEVGSKIGDAFNKVIKQRRELGAVMGNELKKVGGLTADITKAGDNFKSLIEDNGLKYNSKTNTLSNTSTSKMTAQDLSLLNNYTKELNTLGTTPTIAEIDAHIARTADMVKNFKAQSGIQFMTNGERLISINQNALRGELSATNNPALQAYSDARSAYSDLSGFVNEGAKFLGKVTQSGDFAKDASIAKSSVQSILNGGKKDWLIQLEALTGYKALDESVLALQAMKDAGDFKGLSLLQSMSEGSLPTSKAGFTKQILDYAISKGAKLVAGSPEEQTRAFLQSLSKTDATPSIKNTAPKTSAKGGQSTNNINQSNSSISKSIAQPKVKSTKLSTPKKSIKK